MNKLILTDCDGVLLNWAEPFQRYLLAHGIRSLNEGDYSIETTYGISEVEAKSLIKIFNESANIGFLPPFRDSIYYIRKLHEQYGYTFRVITSLGLNPYSMKLREQNLKDLFGTAIEQVICLDTGVDKRSALIPHKGSGLYWIEDHESNAEIGVELGLNCMLMRHGYNENCTTVPIVDNWKDIYERLIN